MAYGSKGQRRAAVEKAGSEIFIHAQEAGKKGSWARQQLSLPGDALPPAWLHLLQLPYPLQTGDHMFKYMSLWRTFPCPNSPLNTIFPFANTLQTKHTAMRAFCVSHEVQAT